MPQNDTRLPAVERLAGVLLDRIERGEYRAGEWLPTERSLAAEFRADRSTIRAALSSLAQKNLILREPGRRSRVSGPPEGVGLTRNGQALPVSLQTLALLSPQTPHYPATPALQHGALHVLRRMEAPYRLIVLDNSAETREETYRREREALDVIRNEGIQGVIVWYQGGAETLPDVRRLQESGVPMVLVDRRDPAFPCDFVGINNVEAARQAVAYLLDLGHRRIGHLTMEDPTITVRDRERGYEEALLSQGLRPSPELVFRISHQVSLNPPAAEAAAYFLSLADLPTAVFAMNDLLAHAFLAELETRGVSVPGQISVMGFDDIDRYAPHPSPLTTVHQPFEQMGQKAMELLLERLAAPPDAFRHTLLPTRLVIRSSCLPLSEKR